MVWDTDPLKSTTHGYGTDFRCYVARQIPKNPNLIISVIYTFVNNSCNVSRVSDPRWPLRLRWLTIAFEPTTITFDSSGHR